MDDCNSDHPFEIKEEVKNKSKYMIAKQLIEPKSIVVVGGSDDIHKPGGTVLRNLQDGNFKGSLYVVNPKMDEVQGIKAYRDVKDLPEVDCAILAIAAKFCPSTVEVLAKQKNTKAFIILSAGRWIIDRTELYRCLDKPLQWGVHESDPGTEPARGGFDFRFWCNGIVYNGLRDAKRN